MSDVSRQWHVQGRESLASVRGVVVKWALALVYCLYYSICFLLYMVIRSWLHTKEITRRYIFNKEQTVEKKKARR